MGGLICYANLMPLEDHTAASPFDSSEGRFAGSVDVVPRLGLLPHLVAGRCDVVVVDYAG